MPARVKHVARYVTGDEPTSYGPNLMSDNPFTKPGLVPFFQARLVNLQVSFARRMTLGSVNLKNVLHSYSCLINSTATMGNNSVRDHMAAAEPSVEVATEETVASTNLASIALLLEERPSFPVRSRLYLSHFLSTWNSRVFEFGAVLFLSTIFPGTLLPASVYALARAASVILFSSFVGHFIDHGERMHVVRVSISRSTPLSYTQYPYRTLHPVLTTPSRPKSGNSLVLYAAILHGFGLPQTLSSLGIPLAASCACCVGLRRKDQLCH